MPNSVNGESAGGCGGANHGAAKPAGRVGSAWIAVLVSVPLIWGYNWIVFKKALAYTGPFQFAAFRFLGGSAILFAYMAAKRRPFRVRPISSVIWIGVLGSAANTGLSLWVVLLGPVGRAALLSYAMPFWVLLVSWPLLHEKPTRLQWIATFTAVGGIGLIVYDSASGHNGLAAALAVLSGITWAGGTVLSRQLLIREKCDLLALTTWQMLVGGIIMEACALLVPGRPTSFTPSFLLLLLYELLPATVVGWLLWSLLLRKVEASVASLAILATPIIGLAFSMLEMGERPAWIEALGMGLMVVALLLVGPLALRQVRRERPGASSR